MRRQSLKRSGGRTHSGCMAELTSRRWAMKKWTKASSTRVRENRKEGCGLIWTTPHSQGHQWAGARVKYVLRGTSTTSASRNQPVGVRGQLVRPPILHYYYTTHHWYREVCGMGQQLRGPQPEPRTGRLRSGREQSSHCFQCCLTRGQGAGAGT